MGLFSKLSMKRKKGNESNIIEEKPIERKKEAKRPVRLNTKEDRIGYIKDNCEAVIDCGRQVEEAKVEYQAVTSYLTDMQKIDLIPVEEREALEDAATKIISLTKERGKLQNKSTILSDRQYRMLEQYEPQLVKEISAIKESEEYQSTIMQDINHLEKERIRLNREQEDIISKQAFLKGIGIMLSIVVVFLFSLFAILSNSSETDYTIPFSMTVIMAMVAAFYIFTEARKNIISIQQVKAKQNRQIMLMNKVKIKSVNNLNYLDYIYQKYMVNNYEQLRILWEEYKKVKEEEKRYQKNTDQLELYHKALMSELRRFGIADTEIWIYQPTAILDNKEMVEVRHRLNVRRQKLRERIDLNMKQKEEALLEITTMLRSYPDCKEEGEKLLRKYRIELME